MALTPLFSPHNLIVLLLITVTAVSFRSAVLGFTILFIPGYVVAPVADKLGYYLLADSPRLIPFWTGFFDLPLMQFSDLNNTYTLGSLIVSLLLFIPMFAGVRYFVFRYRKDLKDKIEKSRWYKAVANSKIFIWLKKAYDLLGNGAHA